jgi:hypothetical protein
MLLRFREVEVDGDVRIWLRHDGSPAAPTLR